MKIFIRDTGENDKRRERILNSLGDLLTKRRIGQALNERDKNIKLFLYHISDIADNQSEYDAIKEIVSKDSSTLLIEYSGTTSHSEITSNIWKVPPKLIINNIASFLKHYLEEEFFDAEILLGRNRAYEMSIELLNKFFPLDIQLQMGDVGKCKKTACELMRDEELNDIATKLSKITKQIVIRDSKGRFVVEEKFHRDIRLQELLESLNKIMELVLLLTCKSEIKTNITQETITGIFGLKKEQSETLNKEDIYASLREDGFHRRYEKLRDQLLSFVEEQSRYDNPSHFSG